MLVPITIPAAATNPSVVPRKKSTWPKRTFPRVEEIATGIWTTWLTPIADKVGARRKTKIGTSSTGPPVPVRADPKPTTTPICNRRRGLKEWAARSAEEPFAKALTPVAVIRVARSTISTSAGSAALLSAPNTAAGTIPASSHNTIPQSTLLRREYAIVPTRPVKRKLHMPVAIATWRSRPPTIYEGRRQQHTADANTTNEDANDQSRN